MHNRLFLIRNSLFIFLYNFPIWYSSSQDDLRPWERLGLSQTEWKQVKENDVPISKVEKLLKYGIGIGEYLEKPGKSWK